VRGVRYFRHAITADDVGVPHVVRTLSAVT